MPFVFESGVACKDFDEFALGCERHWDAAVELLTDGSLQQFFKGMGRLDLAQIAKEAANFPDHDRGLDQFLTRLPTSSLPPAKLEVQPKLINLGTLKMGQNSQLELTLENQGCRLIFGSISSTSPWLAVTDTGEARLFQFRDNVTITIPVKGQLLRAGVKPLEGDLLVESNAGTFNLKVIANVPVQAFPNGCLAGARTPRELADKAKKNPTEAGMLFASGMVARWYQSNGWTYPVQGPASTGMSAVQQFFEALGLSRPPKVFIKEPRIHLRGIPGTKLSHQIVVRTEEPRAVFAHGVSSAGWCIVKPGKPNGNSVTLPVEITVPDEASEPLQTLIRVTSNGQQKFDVPVQVTIDAAPVSKAAAVVAASPKASPPIATQAPPDVVTVAKTTFAAPNIDPLRVLTHVAPLVLLGFVLIGLIAKDVWSDAPAQRVAVNDEPAEQTKPPDPQDVQFKVAIQDEPDDGPVFVPVARFEVKDEPEERFVKLPPPPVKVEIKDEPGENNGPAVAIATNPLVGFSTTEPPTHFDITATGAAGSAAFKQLTYARNGSTNSNVVSVNGGKADFGSFGGRWTRKNLALNGIDATSGAGKTSHSTWIWGKVAYHQVLEVVPGQPVVVNGASRRQLDTVLVRWVIENTDNVKSHSAGLRMELDTLIGSNDGVPFTVPGSSRLVDTYADFKQAKDVPDFVQALERASLGNPGTIAHLTLKTGSGLEPPSRVSLTHWSGGTSAWNVPITNLTGDSSVVMYWPEKAIKPGGKRVVGFAYGLGNVASTDKLGITIGGQIEPGQAFTVSAYVENPIAGQTVRLELPDGLRRTEGAETQNVAQGNGGARNTSIVSWKVLVERTGEFKLKVASSTGLTQAKTISIAQGNAPTGGKLALDLQGSFEPGAVFSVIGKVNEPLDNQTLTLHLPTGLEKIAGDDKQIVPAPAVGSKDSQVEWKVRVVQPGKYAVRVSSSTGIAQTKTITIVQPSRSEGAFQILLTGDFAPGKTFTVSTSVVNPMPDQKLTLVLPAGLERTDGDETQSAVADGKLIWKVKVAEAGKFTVGVKSSTGVTQRKTVTIEPPSDQPGRFNFDFSSEVRDARPGKEFKVIALVANPTVGQKLTLVLPKGLELAKGDATQPVDGTLPIAWTVRVTETGRLPVRVESSTGLARTKTITLAEPTSTLFGR